MANINIDTVELKEIGKEIMMLTSELNVLLDSLYSEIGNAPWSGIAANEFKKKMNNEKVCYISLKDNIYSYGKLLYDAADQFDLSINEIKYSDKIKD